MLEEANNEKERDQELSLSCINLAAFPSYLLIPSKFVMTHQRVKQFKGRYRLELHYAIPVYYLKHIQTYHREVRGVLGFFGLIRPNGMIDRFRVKSTTIIDEHLYVYIEKHGFRIGKIDE